MAGHRKWRDLLAETMTPAQLARAQARRDALAADRPCPEATDVADGLASHEQVREGNCTAARDGIVGAPTVDEIVDGIERACRAP